MAKIKVLLAEDHAVVREALSALLARYDEIDVVGGATDGRSAVDLARALKPDVLLMDLAMPGLNGVDATAQVKRSHPDIKVLMLTGYADDDRVVKALQAGASGYVIKRSDPDELVLAIKSVVRGNTYFSEEIANQGRTPALVQRARSATAKDTLSSREREILQLVAEGSSSQQIADRLVISLKTVEVHRSNIMSKLNARNRTDLILHALRTGLVEIEPPMASEKV
ncbi:MAG TPA: response regulator transcription factor [Dehalococcoidia bacterium]|nr:response regulator transcription factor [Dehalococcoidia bacterium]